MRIRWIKRYKMAWNGPADKMGGYCLDFDMVLQELIRIEHWDPGEGPYTNEEWRDVETFDDLESKEIAIEQLQKAGIAVPLVMKKVQL